MASRTSDQDVDRLYQLPQDDFTRERNALAKNIGGDEGKRIRGLPKPSTSAWAVNQVYWRDRDTFDTLITASERLRAAHRAVLGGKKADLRATDAAHGSALKAALASAMRILKDGGQNVSAATQTEIARTLESLPVDEHPGRLAKPLRPVGFEALQGMPISPRKPASTPEVHKTPAPDKAAQERERKETQRALDAARRREQQDREAVAKFRKAIPAAERKTAAAKSAWERAQEGEARLKADLRQAEEAQEQSAKALRDLQSRSDGVASSSKS
jgi:hypothetical protein